MGGEARRTVELTRSVPSHKSANRLYPSVNELDWPNASNKAWVEGSTANASHCPKRFVDSLCIKISNMRYGMTMGALKPEGRLLTAYSSASAPFPKAVLSWDMALIATIPLSARLV